MSDHSKSALNLYNNYVECMQNLPMDIQRNTSQILEYNSKCLSTMSKIEDLAENSSNFKELKELLTSVKVLGDSKVQVAQSTSDTVKNMVERLQNDKKTLNTFTDENKSVKSKVKEKINNSDYFQQRNVPSTITAFKEPKPTKQSNDNDSNAKNNNTKFIKNNRSNKTNVDKTEAIIKSPSTVPIVQRSNIPFPRATATVQVLSQHVQLKKLAQKTKTKRKYKKQCKNISSSSSDDEDVDPNEPTYCVCKEISYGDMICCDNDLCPIQWFHFKCVSLLTNPKGKWFCPTCRGDRPNTMKPKAQFLDELEKYNKEKENKH